MALSARTHFGPYEILGPIGAGGMGEVYRKHMMVVPVNDSPALTLVHNWFEELQRLAPTD